MSNEIYILCSTQRDFPYYKVVHGYTWLGDVAVKWVKDWTDAGSGDFEYHYEALDEHRGK